MIRPVLAAWPLSCCRRVSRSLTLPHRGPIRTIPTGSMVIARAVTLLSAAGVIATANATQTAPTGIKSAAPAWTR